MAAHKNAVAPWNGKHVAMEAGERPQAGRHQVAAAAAAAAADMALLEL